jgi:hypothetical protein
MKRANLIRDNRVGLIKTYKNSFKGQEFVDWLVKDKNIGNFTSFIKIVK